ncbi:MAG: hypothetical protein FJX25_08285 [Alphaproteobacteria bacterium]|nr:hypothetical protein [Alphaproteobacteria bacterium]
MTPGGQTGSALVIPLMERGTVMLSLDDRKLLGLDQENCPQGHDGLCAQLPTLGEGRVTLWEGLSLGHAPSSFFTGSSWQALWSASRSPWLSGPMLEHDVCMPCRISVSGWPSLL